MTIRESIDLRADFVRVAVRLHLRKDETVGDGDRGRSTREERLREWDFESLAQREECVIGDRLTIHRKRVETESACPQVRLHCKDETVQRFACPVGIGDGLVHGRGLVRVVQLQIHYILWTFQRRDRWRKRRCYFGRKRRFCRNACCFSSRRWDGGFC